MWSGVKIHDDLMQQRKIIRIFQVKDINNGTHLSYQSQNEHCWFTLLHSLLTDSKEVKHAVNSVYANR